MLTAVGLLKPRPPLTSSSLILTTVFVLLLYPPGADMDPNPRAALERQQLRLRERQKFFEDILQPETEFVFPLSHLHLESQRREFQVLRNRIRVGRGRCPQMAFKFWEPSPFLFLWSSKLSLGLVCLPYTLSHLQPP